MKKIQKHVLKGKTIFIGLEDSKRSWKLCVRSEGVIVSDTSMPAKYEVLRNYLLNAFPECKITVMYEAGFRGFNLHDQLVADGWSCVVTPPHTVTEEKSQRRKNDRIDCRRLSKNLENRDYKKCYVPDKQLREDRQISRTYEQAKRDVNRVCNRIRRTLEFHGLDDIFVPGRWTQSDYKRLKSKLEEMDLSASLQFSFSVLFSELECLWELKKATLDRLHQLGKSESYKDTVAILESAPGVGPLTAIRLALEWGDMNRFKRKESFSNFTGLVPSEYSTGEQERKGHITKQGNRQVRGWLIESAWTAIRRDTALLDKYMRVYKSSGSKKIAIVAVARKLAVRLRTLMITGQTYQIGLMSC
jgi:transposase